MGNTDGKSGSPVRTAFIRDVIGGYKTRNDLKQTASILAIFFLTTSFACGQNLKSTNSTFNEQELIDGLTNSIDQKFIIQNPELNLTKPSFFNKDNENKYFVGLLQISGYGVPFTWDDNLSILKFLVAWNNDISVKQGMDAHENYQGTKIAWNKNINGLVWFNDKAYKAIVRDWHLIAFSDCSAVTFPTLSYNKVTEIPNARINNIEGLAILPYSGNFRINRTETIIKTENGDSITGLGYDIDTDGIFDIFSYVEEIDDTTTYKRLYRNISGQWKCTWTHLSKVCI